MAKRTAMKVLRKRIAKSKFEFDQLNKVLNSGMTLSEDEKNNISNKMIKYADTITKSSLQILDQKNYYNIWLNSRGVDSNG